MKRRGFSLVETLIALALETLLIPIGLSLYSSYGVQTELARRVRHLDVLWSVLEEDEVPLEQGQVLLTGQEERVATLKDQQKISGVIQLRRYRRREGGK